ncbi:putative pentatricopeptide repeat-containing protein At1g12700, mitochondrial [Salvia miltiorrhiza]|uniref:putative pentatricopeptide repeat-containing protein At1g12700, mitochondrial n=1 Tax=Salvia miltiorrhiza TaxID=226208 RepID=UPI0025AC7648|nr:putative pentatricopeptide repeat-containing protein At1g12700, mitochondrial [Salvia miltiorrhiza]
MRSNHAAMFLARILSNSSSQFSTFAIASPHYQSFLVPSFHFDNASCQMRRHFSAYPRFDFGTIREPNDAVALFREMVRTQPLPYVSVFSKLLSTVVKMEQYSLALHLIDEMLQRDVPVDHYTLNIAIDCYCRQKRPDFGFAILGIFFKRGYEPTVVTFNTLVKGLLLVGRVPEAAKVLWKMSVYRLCEPNEQTHSTMINGICKAVGTLHALELLCLLEKEKGICKPNVYAYSAVIDSLFKEGKVDDALQLFSSLGDKGISPNVVTYNSMIEGFCNLRRMDEAQDVLKKMIADKVCPNVVTCNIFVTAWCRDGKVQEAEHMLVSMKEIDVKPNIFIYTTLINGYCMQGKMDEAVRIFQLAVNYGIKPNIVSYNSLMNGYCKKGQVDEVSRLFTIIPAKRLERNVVSYNIMLEALFRKGRCEDGLNLFKEMQALGLSPHVKTYNILLDGLCNAHRISEAFSMLHTMKDRGVLPNIVTYNVLIEGLCINNKVREAKDLFDELPSKGLLKRNKASDAIPLLEEMYARGFTLVETTFSMLIEPMVREGRDSVLFDKVKKLVPKDHNSR